MLWTFYNEEIKTREVYDCPKFHAAWLLTSYKTGLLSVFIYSLMDSANIWDDLCARQGGNLLAYTSK